MRSLDSWLKIIRELKPDVVITHDAGVVMVILTTSPPTMLSSGHSTQPTTRNNILVLVQPISQLNYISVYGLWVYESNGQTNAAFRQNPHRAGRNKDIDMTKMFNQNYPIQCGHPASKTSHSYP